MRLFYMTLARKPVRNGGISYGVGHQKPPPPPPRLGRRIVDYLFAASRKSGKAHPLLIGVVLLFLVSGVAGRSTWGFPGFLDDSQSLGGAVVVEEIHDFYSPYQGDVLVKAPSPFFNLQQALAHVEEEEAMFLDAELVTVPWTPVLPEGASARNVREYTIEQGDTLSSIANAYGVSMRAVAYSNNIVDPDSIQPGDELRIPPVNGVLHIVKKDQTIAGIAKKYGAEAEKIITFNGLPADGALTIGDELVVPDGAPPAPPKPKYVPTPRYTANRVPLGYYIAPTTGHNYGRLHSGWDPATGRYSGVDVANRCGTPVYAAAAGTITRADGVGWNGGFGKVIEIGHSNGTWTRYAHFSQIVVWSGWVEQGQLIALMGTTGRSTGCHLHFEVHGARNPLGRY